MKILFVDIQGTLSVGKDFDPDWVNLTDSCLKAMVALKNAVPDLKLVITSQIRFSKEASTMGRVYAYLRHAGFPYREIQEPTPRGNDRGEEITAWLKAHPAVTQYAIVDDSFVNHPNFIQVDPNTGLTLNHVPRIVKYFTA
jgi:hypothetical protein